MLCYSDEIKFSYKNKPQHIYREFLYAACHYFLQIAFGVVHKWRPSKNGIFRPSPKKFLLYEVVTKSQTLPSSPLNCGRHKWMAPFHNTLSFRVVIRTSRTEFLLPTIKKFLLLSGIFRTDRFECGSNIQNVCYIAEHWNQNLNFFIRFFEEIIRQIGFPNDIISACTFFWHF